LEPVLTVCVLALYVAASFDFARRDLVRWLWGINIYSYFPSFFLVLVVLGASLAFIPQVSRRLLSALDLLVSRIRWPGSPAVRGVLVGLVFFIFCRLFPSRVHFLGDGRTLVRGVSGGMQFYPSNLVDFYLHSVLAGLLGSGERSYLWLSCAAGGAYAVVAYFLARSLVKGGGARLLALVWLLSVGTLVQFFGYAESYALFIVSLEAYLLFSLRLLNNSAKSPFLPLCLGSLSCCLHPTGLNVVLSAAFLVIWFLRIRKEESPYGWKRGVLSAAGGILLPPVVVVTFFYLAGFDFRLFFQEGVSRGRLFLPFLPSAVEGGDYWIFSAGHFVDLVNLVLLIFPALLFFPFVFEGAGPVRQSIRSPGYRFLFLVSGAFVVFFFLMDFKIALYRDWDLFSIPGPLVAVFLLFLMVRDGKLIDPVRLLRLTVINLVALLPWVLLNASEGPSLERFSQLSNAPGLHRRAVEAAHNFEELAIYYREKGRLDLEEEFYRRAIERQPSARYLTALGHLLGEDMRLYEAAEAYEKALSIDPNYLPALNNLGMLYFEMDKPSEAFRCFERLTSLEPDWLSYYKLGVAYRGLGYIDKATAALEKSVSFESVMGQSYLELAEIYFETGDRPKAYRLLKELLTYHPEDPQYLKGYGDLLFRLEEYDKCEEIYRALLLHDSEDWEFNAGLGKVLSVTGRKDEAAGFFSKAFENLPAQKLRPYYDLAEILFRHREYALTEKCLTHVLEIVPSHLSANLLLAELLVETGRSVRAVGLLEKIAPFNKTSKKLWYNLGLSNLASGKAENAAACLDILRALAPESELTAELEGRLSARGVKSTDK
ncbi:MAG TPA: tetratricopeptide repeat protein, partial [archaeon]|nr:tetratricopeptide repeat protein [archaeon]